MRVSIKNTNGRLYAVTPDGREHRMIHSYIREPVVDVGEIVGTRRIGAVVAVEVDGEILYGFSMVKPPDTFNPKLGLKIAAGKALTRPLVDPEELQNCAGYSHKDPSDDLLMIYNRAQRYLRPLLHD